MIKRALPLAAIVALLLVGAGCKPGGKEITALARKEAESLASEGQFALSVRDVARAEATLAKAAALCPDTGDYWLELGRCRVKLGNRGTAKDAYKSAIDAYQADAKREPAVRVPAVLRQIYVLALLGRVDDARALLAKTQKELPDNRDVRAFAEAKQIDQWVASPAFKEVAL
jgi:tetratricopeptide (TPR) repeat protein